VVLTLEFHFAEHNSDWYLKALDLRRRVLRWPLGLEYSEDDLRAEAGETTVVAVENGRVVGTIQLRALDDRVMKVRQVAVDDEVQGQGVGRRMSEAAEAWMRERGFEEIVLHARAVVLPFYEKQGYVVVGDEFTEVGIPHRKMVKALSG